jgi:hypothetical protein
VTAPNHALTGALIGLSVANPVLALPLAFVSHLLQDTVPHYDPAEPDMAKLRLPTTCLGRRSLLTPCSRPGGNSAGSLASSLSVCLRSNKRRHVLDTSLCARATNGQGPATDQLVFALAQRTAMENRATVEMGRDCVVFSVWRTHCRTPLVTDTDSWYSIYS